MLVLRIVSGVFSWIVVSIVFNVLFMFHGYNMAYISLVMAPGILPFIPFFYLSHIMDIDGFIYY